MINYKILSKNLIAYTNNYVNLSIGNKNVRAPYFLNTFYKDLKSAVEQDISDAEELEILFGRFRQNEFIYAPYGGKGTPEELIQSAIMVSNKVGLSLDLMDAKGMILFMHLFGIGVDCSGFVYNALNYALSKMFNDSGYLEKKLILLSGLHRFGVSVKTFASNKNSYEINDVQNINTGDLLIKLSTSGDHIMLVLKRNDKFIYYAHSSLFGIPTGVSLGKTLITNPTKSIKEQKLLQRTHYGRYVDLSKYVCRRLNFLMGFLLLVVAIM